MLQFSQLIHLRQNNLKMFNLIYSCLYSQLIIKHLSLSVFMIKLLSTVNESILFDNLYKEIRLWQNQCWA